MPIKGFIENSLIEWEGKIVSILFLSGCNFRCTYCHSPHLVLPMDGLETIPEKSILQSLKRNLGWIDGVVISGGEPTLSSGLVELIQSLRALGLAVKLDTNGSNPEALEVIIGQGLVDYVAMDIKAPLRRDRYEAVTKCFNSVESIRRSIDIITDSGIDYEFRTTVCPSQLSEEDIVDIAKGVSGARRYVLQHFRPQNCLEPDMLEVEPYPLEYMSKLKAAAMPFVMECTLRGEGKSPEEERNW